jgi:hypothetical protein
MKPRRVVPAALVALSWLVMPAWAHAQYSVAVRVPTTVAHGQRFAITVVGRASAPAILYVALDSRSCATSIKREAARRLRGTAYSVHGRFRGALPKAPAPQQRGPHYVCAYLYLGLGQHGGKLASDTTRAHASATYRVIGAVWTATSGVAPTGVGENTIDGLTCASESLCVGWDYAAGMVFTSTDPADGGAATWTRTVIDPSASDFGSELRVSCPSVSLCVAVDGSGDVLTSTNPGAGPTATWARAVLGTQSVRGTDSLTGVSCASVSLCVAVGWDGFAYTTADPADGSGASWATSVPQTMDGNNLPLGGVTCSASFCIAFGAQGGDFTTTDPGAGSSATWSSDSSVAGGETVTNMSCPSMTLCAASAGNAWLSNDPIDVASSTWATPTQFNDAAGPNAIACPSTTECVGIWAGQTATGGAVWTSRDPLTSARSSWDSAIIAKYPSSYDHLTAISCPSVVFCAVADSTGTILTTTDAQDG